MPTTDENLGNRQDSGTLFKNLADLAAEIVLLEFDGIEIDAAVADAEPAEQLAHGPAEFAPLQREHHDRLVFGYVVEEFFSSGIESDGSGWC